MSAAPVSAAGKTPPMQFPLTCLVDFFAGRHGNGITRKGRVLDDSSAGLSVGEWIALDLVCFTMTFYCGSSWISAGHKVRRWQVNWASCVRWHLMATETDFTSKVKTKDTSSATICLFFFSEEEVPVIKMLLLSSPRTEEEQVDHRGGAEKLTFGFSPLHGS